MPGCREVSRTLGRTPGHAGDMAQVRGSAAECSQGPGQSAGTPGPASPGLRPMDHGRCTQAPGPWTLGARTRADGPRAMDDGPRITNVSVAPKVWQRSGRSGVVRAPAIPWPRAWPSGAMGRFRGNRRAASAHTVDTPGPPT